MSGLNKVAKNVRLLSGDLLSEEFWKDASKITSYAQGIFHYAGVEGEVKASLGSDSACCSWDLYAEKKVYNINIPKIAQFTHSEELDRLIYARMMFLKHELGHALFPLANAPSFLEVANNYRSFVNWVDDTRIEFLFGNLFKGSRVGFSDLRNVFFNNMKNKLNLSKLSLDNFGGFIRFELAGYTFPSGTNVDIYRSFFLDDSLKELLIEEPESFLIACRDIAEKFLKYLKDQESESKDEEPEDEEPGLEDLEDEDSEDESSESEDDESEDEGQESEDQESEDDESEDEGQESEDQESEDDESEDEGQESEDQESKDEGQESEDDESEDEGQESEDDESEDEGDEAEEADFETKDSEKKSEDEDDSDGSNIETEKDVEDKSEIESRDKESDADRNVDDECSYDDLAKTNITKVSGNDITVEEVKKLPFKELDYDAAVEADFLSLTKYFKKLPNLTNKKGKNFYNEIVQEYSATISNCVKFMNLKLQNRTRDRIIDRQLEGSLDEKNITDIIVTPENPRAFLRKVHGVKIDSTIHILLDISGSMSGQNLHVAITNAVIIAEVCKRLKCDFALYLFTSPTSYNFKKNVDDASKNKVIKEVFGNSAHKIEQSYDYGGIYFDNENAIIYSLKSKTYKVDAELQIALGNLVQNVSALRFILGVTPEFESMLKVKTLKRPGKNFLFVINDGHFNSDFLNDIYETSSINTRGITTFPEDIKVLKVWVSKQEEIIQSFIDDRTFIDDCVAIPDNYWFHCNDKDKIIEYLNIIKKVYSEFHSVKKTSDFKKYNFVIKDDSHTNRHVVLSDLKMDEITTDEIDRQNIIFLLDKIAEEHVAKNNIKNIVYASLITKMREENWKIVGIGIRSDGGKLYIGKDSFTVINDVDELKTTFSNSLKKVF